MIYLITKMIAYLVAASLIGLALGWILRSLGVEKAKKQLEYSHQDKLDALIEQHHEELAEFAENAKQSRADLKRLETNNQALRETISTNNEALELAQKETAQLSASLKTSNSFNKEILEATGHTAEEFDQTIEVREQTFDNSNIEFTGSELDDSLVSTQDKTMMEAENIGDGEIEVTPVIEENPESAEPLEATESPKEKANDEPVEITMGNLWSHIGKVVGTKK